MSKFTKEEIDYYKKGAYDITLTSEDFDKIAADRIDKISNMGTDTVARKMQKHKASEFKNDAEYKYYQLAVFEAACEAERGRL